MSPNMTKEPQQADNILTRLCALFSPVSRKRLPQRESLWYQKRADRYHPA